MSSQRRFAGNFLIQTLGKSGSVVIGLFIIALLARALGPEAYGEYTTIVAFLQFFGIIVDFGLTLTLVVMISKKEVDEERVTGNVFGLRMFSAILLFGLAPLIALPFPWSSTIKIGIAVGAIAYTLMAGATVLIGIFQKHESMWRPAVAEISNRFVLLALIAIFAYTGGGVVLMIVAMIVANLIWLFLMIYFAKPFVKIRPKIEKEQWKAIINKSWPIAVSIALNLIYLRGDIIILSFFRNEIEVGFYGLAYRVIDVLTTLPVIYMGLLLPSLTRDWTSGNKKEFQTHLSRAFNTFAIIAFPIVAGTQAVAEPLVVLIAGNEFLASGTILKLLILAVAGVFFGALYGHAVVAVNKQRSMIWGYGITAIIAIIGYIILIPMYGMWGAVTVTIFSELLVTIIAFIMVWKTSKAVPKIVVPIKAILASAVMYWILISLPTMNVLISIIIGVIVYFIIMLAIQGVRWQDLHQLLPQKLANNKE